MAQDIDQLENAFRDIDIRDTIVSVESNLIPKLCLTCNNHPICNPLTVFIDLFKTGIDAEIKTCVYFRKIVK